MTDWGENASCWSQRGLVGFRLGFDFMFELGKDITANVLVHLIQDLLLVVGKESFFQVGLEIHSKLTFEFLNQTLAHVVFAEGSVGGRRLVNTVGGRHIVGVFVCLFVCLCILWR